MSRENKTPASASRILKVLWEDGFFKSWRDRPSVIKELSKGDNHFTSMEIGVSLMRAKYLIRRGKKGSFEYIQKVNAVSKKVESLQDQLFSSDLTKKLQRNFGQELSDLNLNFNKSGNCTSFVLRKILEKLIYIVFAKNGIESKLTKTNGSGQLIGLEAMINLASSEKIKGMPIITSKTGHEIAGIKFLGDTSAHNPLVDVDMATIIPQMPFIITAYKELASYL